MARPSAAQAKVPRRFISGTARLGQYDRIKPDSPTYIRTTERKPGCGQALVKAVVKPKRDKKPRVERPPIDSRIMVIHRVVMRELLPALDKEKRPTHRARIIAEIKRLRSISDALCTDAGIRPLKVVPDHKVSTANKLRAIEAAKEHAPGPAIWER